MGSIISTSLIWPCDNLIWTTFLPGPVQMLVLAYFETLAEDFSESTRPATYPKMTVNGGAQQEIQEILSSGLVAFCIPP